MTRNKHDGGDTGELVQHALSCVGATLEDVRLVVANNHHHRVLPFERRIPWSVKMGVYPQSYDSPQNLIPEAEARAELSHHLAHAWSVAELSPFDRGLIVVMDGMGEAYGAMAKAEATLSRARGGQQNKDVVSGTDDGGGDGADRMEDDVRYYNDLRLMREMREEAKEEQSAAADFQQIPEEFVPHEAYREAESAFTFAPNPGVKLYSVHVCVFFVSRVCGRSSQGCWVRWSIRCAGHNGLPIQRIPCVCTRDGVQTSAK